MFTWPLLHTSFFDISSSTVPARGVFRGSCHSTVGTLYRNHQRSELKRHKARHPSLTRLQLIHDMSFSWPEAPEAVRQRVAAAKPHLIP